MTGKIAEAHPYAEVGQLLLSMRHLGMLAVLDPESETITWAALGPWRRQHDPDFLENGNLLIFDNFGHLGLGGASRVIEVNPSTLGVVWEYTGEKENFFYSPTRSQQQRLPNGNTLIVEADAGRIFEITMDKRIVWEYINPAQVRDKIAALVDATRIDPASLTFLENEERQ